MPELHLFPSNELPRDIKCQILSFIRIQWWDIFRDNNRFWDFTQKSTHPINVVLTERGLVISHAEINWRLLDHAGQTFKLYGVSAVFTYPAFRKEGYGSQVMGAVTDYLRASDADLAMLFCVRELVPFYEKAGWEAPAGLQVHYSDPLYPHAEEIATCLLFVSARAQAARVAFLAQPVYIGLHSW